MLYLWLTISHQNESKHTHLQNSKGNISFNPYQKIVQLSRKDKIFGITYTLQ